MSWRDGRGGGKGGRYGKAGVWRIYCNCRLIVDDYVC
jgi:hypothetical protein